MNKQNILIGVMLASGILFSCEQTEMESTLAAFNAGKEVAFNIGISSLTRTATTGNKTVFVANDELGLFAVNRNDLNVIDGQGNLRYVYRDNYWDADKAITFPIDGSQVNFYSYYPYSASVTTTIFEHQVAKDQSVENAYDQSDLLLASHTTSTSDDISITLTFAHKLALVEVILPSDKVGISAEMKAKRTVTVNLLEQTATLKDTEAEEWIAMKKVSNTVFRAVVPAQTLGVGHLIRIKLDGGGYYHHSTTSKITLNANKITTFSMSDKDETGNI